MTGHSMIWYGIQKTTFVDFPGRIAATLFTGGCNFRCPWCHNQDLVYPERLKRLPVLDDEEVKSFLIRRKHQLEGICITGGEPTLWGDTLLAFLDWAKSLGYAVKVDTNGSNPSWVHKAITSQLLDFIAMDIKHPWETYDQAIGVHFDVEILKQTVAIIRESGVPHQFRTTLIPGLSEQTMQRLAETMGITIVFQTYRDPLVYTLDTPPPMEGLA